MQFFEIINAALVILAWIIVLAVAWALLPAIQKFLEMVRRARRIFQ